MIIIIILKVIILISILILFIIKLIFKRIIIISHLSILLLDRLLIEDSSHVNHLGIRCLLDSIFALFEPSSSSSSSSITNHTNDMNDTYSAITSYPAFAEQPARLVPLVIGCLSSYLQGRAMESDNTTRILQIIVQCMKGILPDWCNNMYVVERSVLWFIHRLSEEEKWNIQKKSMLALIKASAMHCYASFFTPSLFYEMGIAITEPILKDKRVKDALYLIKKIELYTLSKHLPIKYVSFIVCIRINHYHHKYDHYC